MLEIPPEPEKVDGGIAKINGIPSSDRAIVTQTTTAVYNITGGTNDAKFKANIAWGVVLELILRIYNRNERDVRYPGRSVKGVGLETA